MEAIDLAASESFSVGTLWWADGCSGLDSNWGSQNAGLEAALMRSIKVLVPVWAVVWEPEGMSFPTVDGIDVDGQRSYLTALAPGFLERSSNEKHQERI